MAELESVPPSGKGGCEVEKTPEELAQDVAYQNQLAETLLKQAGPDGKLDLTKLLPTRNELKR